MIRRTTVLPPLPGGARPVASAQQRQPEPATPGAVPHHVNGGPFPVESWSDIRFQDNRGRAFSRADVFSYKKVFFLFAANWNPICKLFVKQLADHYKAIQKCRGEGALQIVYVSFDENSVEFAKFFQQMPWLAVPYRETECAARLKLLFDVSALPQLAALDAEKIEILARDVRERFGIATDALDAFDELAAGGASGNVDVGGTNKPSVGGTEQGVSVM
mmetsp:Transcript_25850/g.65172  ORF Transcript_25850/g.65172 Transcript_25850/m.65172 type:complete len:218 (+) Transcript_25850:176-829(+)